MFPRCGIPDPYGGWQGWEDYVAFLYRTGSITEHTQIWWSVRPHLAYPTVEIRICDGQPDLAEAQSLAALGYALAARCARARRRGRAAPERPAPAARGEHVARDPYGLSASCSTRPRRARAGARAARAAPRLGRPGRRRDRRGAVPRDPGAERRRAADRALRGGRQPRARSTPSRSGRESQSWLTRTLDHVEDLAEELRSIEVGQFLLATRLDAGHPGLREARAGRPLPGKAAVDAGVPSARTSRASYSPTRAGAANLQVAYAGAETGSFRRSM